MQQEPDARESSIRPIAERIFHPSFGENHERLAKTSRRKALPRPRSPLSEISIPRIPRQERRVQRNRPAIRGIRLAYHALQFFHRIRRKGNGNPKRVSTGLFLHIRRAEQEYSESPARLCTVSTWQTPSPRPHPDKQLGRKSSPQGRLGHIIPLEMLRCRRQEQQCLAGVPDNARYRLQR